ncbi:unnamed protein product [Nezara viridula]|uniref:Uncharacterized protein n=1 Tax=Nezara viridula TaxID=85310 RepID=A0A9P0HS93_NEZVI|nr:unnamed protein product [Nezara viridula]
MSAHSGCQPFHSNSLQLPPHNPHAPVGTGHNEAGYDQTSGDRQLAQLRRAPLLLMIKNRPGWTPVSEDTGLLEYKLNKETNKVYQSRSSECLWD